MSSLSASSTIDFQLLAFHEVFQNGRDRTIHSLHREAVGEVKERARRRIMGFEPIPPELKMKSNHFSTGSLEHGFMRSSREISVVSNTSNWV